MEKAYLCKINWIGMRFRDIIGQATIKQQLISSVREERIAHAQLLTGPEGVGKLQLAIAYAQYIACAHRTETDSCGECPSCLQYQKLQHPDLHFAFPITESGEVCDSYVDKFREMILSRHYFDLDDWYKALGTENKQGMIYEKESSEILRKLSLKSFSNGYKVMIIWQPEKMHAACANKLLKLLEEPPEKTLFLLVSEHPLQLLTTILSRVQQIHVPKLSDEEIMEDVRCRMQNDECKVQDIVRLANGSVLKARKLLDESDTKKQFFEDFKSLMRRAWMVGHKKNYDALLELYQWSQDMADSKVGRERQKAFLQYAQSQVRENFIRNFHMPQINYQTSEEQDFSKNFAQFIHEGNVEQLMHELERAEKQISQNGNSKMIFFDLCLQVIVMIK